VRAAPYASTVGPAVQRAVLSWRFLIGSLIGTTLLIPPGWYRLPSVLPADLGPYRIVLFLVLILWGTSALTDEDTTFRATGVDGAMAFVVAAVLASFVVNLFETRPPDEFATALKALLYLGAALLLVYAINSVMRNRGDIEQALKSTVWISAVVGAFGVVERLTTYNVFAHLHEVIPLLEYTPPRVAVNSSLATYRIAGSSEHPIALAVVLGMILPLAIHYARAANSTRARVGYSSAALLIATSMFLTGSRTAFVAFATVLVILWLTTPQIRKWTVPGLLALAVVLHLAFPGAISSLTERLSPSFLQRTETGNEAGRLADYPRVAAIFADRALFGLGFGTFDAFRYFWLDNQFLKLLVEVGALGVAAFAWLFARSARLMYRTGRVVGGETGDLLVALSASVIVFAISGALFDSFGFPQVFHVFFILLGLGTALVAAARHGDVAEACVSPFGGGPR
jgi:hypothetical protein